jgi:hypothetical protein
MPYIHPSVYVWTFAQPYLAFYSALRWHQWTREARAMAVSLI